MKTLYHYTCLVLAALDVLRENDPMLIIGIADTELRLSWQTDLVRTVLEKSCLQEWKWLHDESRWLKGETDAD